MIGDHRTMVAYYVLGHSFANYFHVPWKDCAGESRSDPKGKTILRRTIEYLMNKVSSNVLVVISAV